MTSPPNILMIVIDCLRADRVHGVARLCSTPAIDRLAERGRSFTQVVASATTTLPSFSSLLTGVLPARTGIRTHVGAQLDRALPTLPEALRGAGYATYASVTGPLLPLSGLDRGFDTYDIRGVDDFVFGSTGDRIVSDIHELPPPWFALVHLFEVHGPRQVLPGAEGRTTYDRAVSSIDRYVGKLVDQVGDGAIVVLTGDHGELIPRNQVSQAVFDNRPVQGVVKRYISPRFTHRPPPLFYGHGVFPVDELLRVPLIVAGPGVGSGVHHHQVRHVDITPTVLESVGIRPGADLDGVSLLTSSTETEDRTALADIGKVVHDEGGWCVVGRQPPWKVYRFPQREHRSLVVEREGRRTRSRERPPEVRALIATVDRYASGYAADDEMPRLSSEEEAELRRRLERIGYL